MRAGQSFEAAEVAECYKSRPPYPPEIFQTLVNLSPRCNSLLDLGCGTGKIARGLSESFKRVVAVDPSSAMLNVAQEMPGGDAKNITWIESLAETVELSDPPDLIVAAASIHWMDHRILFPKLQKLAPMDHVFAVVDGDTAHEPPWFEAWEQFLARWLMILQGEKYEPDRTDSAFNIKMTRHREWLDISDTSYAEFGWTQSIDQFISCQHSRDTFAPAKLSEKMNQYDSELRALLEPYAENDMITYTVRTRIEWGQIKSSI